MEWVIPFPMFTFILFHEDMREFLVLLNPIYVDQIYNKTEFFRSTLFYGRARLKGIKLFHGRLTLEDIRILLRGN